MQLHEIQVEGYRSLKSLRLPVGPLTVLVGRNGAGKTNICRALRLVRSAADGTICRRIAEEGGVDSALWAGPRERLTHRLALVVRLDHLEYRIEIGLPGLSEASLDLEPMVRAEQLVSHHPQRPGVLAERKGPHVWLPDGNGGARQSTRQLLASETALAHLAGADLIPDLAALRQALGRWELYHDIRTDEAAPGRQPALGLSAATLAGDGANLAAVLATLFYVQSAPDPIQAAVADAFPGAELVVSALDGHCRFAMRFPDVERPFGAQELSDGTLRYLHLAAALLGMRPAPLITLNEPEAGLHPSLLAPLARLIASAARTSQIWVVTHSEALAGEIARVSGVAPRLVGKESGVTFVAPHPGAAARAPVPAR